MIWTDFALRISFALFLGACIGMERQWRQRMAGLRTNTLVAVGSALFVTVALMTVDEISPTRIAAQVVSGIGFLGAGVIMREGFNIRGLNTAATLWCSAAVGTLCGSGFLPQAGIGTAAIVSTNLWLRPLARRIDRAPLGAESEVENTYRLSVTCREQDEIQLRALLLQGVRGDSMRLHALASRDTERQGQLLIEADLRMTGRNDHALEELTARFSLEPGVSAVSWCILGEN